LRGSSVLLALLLRCWIVRPARPGQRGANQLINPLNGLLPFASAATASLPRDDILENIPETGSHRRSSRGKPIKGSR